MARSCVVRTLKLNEEKFKKQNVNISSSVLFDLFKLVFVPRCFLFSV